MSPKHLELALREIFRARRSFDALGSELLRKQPRRDRSEGEPAPAPTARACYPRPTAPLSSVDTSPLKEARGTASHYCKLARPSKYTQSRTDSPSSLPSKPIGRPRRPVHPRPCRPNPRSCEQLPTQCATRDTTLILVLLQLALPPFPQTRP